MGKSKPQAPPTATSQNITQTDIPAYARPYYEDILQRGQAESNREYTPYEQDRISGFNANQTGVQQDTFGMQRPDQLGTADTVGTQAGLGAIAAGQYNPNTFNAQQVDPRFQAQTGSFINPGVSQAYASPYMQDVVDVRKDEAIRDAQKGQLTQNLDAARRGTYGGSRQLLATTERERNLGDELSQIQATGSQSAYDAANRAFEQEQGRGLQTQGMNLQYGMQGDLANQQAGLQAQQFGEQSNQFGANLGMQGIQTGLEGARTLADLGSNQQQTDLQRYQAQAAAGAEQQGLEQQHLDTAYGDFLRQRDYPMEQLGYFSNLLRGQSVPLSSSTTSYAQPPSMVSQIGGLGLAGLSAYKMYNGKG